MYDFNKIIDRTNTGSDKWENLKRFGYPEDAISVGTADMDFESPKEVQEVLTKAAKFGIYGYTSPQETFWPAIHDWYAKRHGWEIPKDWHIVMPGVVFAQAMAVRCFTKEGDSVLMQRPVYGSFMGVVQGNGRKIVDNPLVLKNGRYEVDFEDFEQKIMDHHVKLFMLCSPHNPVGRVWEEDELRRMGDICLKHGVFVMIDEIHHDYVRKGYKHTIFAQLGEAHAQNCMVCTAPSKTFNLAGLHIANIFIPNEERRNQVRREMGNMSVPVGGLFEYAACEAAYQYGETWLEEIQEYLEGNLTYIRSFIKERLPKMKLIEPEGTYLLWLDVSEYGYTLEEIKERLKNEVRVWLVEGAGFGPDSDGFLRFDMGSPRAVIEEVMERLTRF